MSLGNHLHTRGVSVRQKVFSDKKTFPVRSGKERPVPGWDEWHSIEMNFPFGKFSKNCCDIGTIKVQKNREVILFFQVIRGGSVFQ